MKKKRKSGKYVYENAFYVNEFYQINSSFAIHLKNSLIVCSKYRSISVNIY